MRAARLKGFGGPEVFELLDLPDLEPQDQEVLLEVKAAGINRPDVFQRKGNYPAPESVAADIPGLEVSGIVRKLGAAVSGLQVGDEVMALLAGGGYANQACVDAGLCIPKPANLSFEEAASLPETMYTVWHNVFQRGKLQAGEGILIHGGAGGIGNMAIQLAHLFKARVYTTVGSQEKADFAKSLGADVCINYHWEDFEQRLKSETINIILDSIGGDYFKKHLNILQEEGRLIQINAMHGAKVELNLLKLMQKRISISGSTLRSRDLAFKRALTQEIIQQVLPLIETGLLRPTVTQVFPLSEVIAAHTYFESHEQFGKIVLNTTR